MNLAEALEALHAVRRTEVVVTTMSAAREWQKFKAHPLDFVLVPSSMGQATSLGLGIALARSEREVIVCNGDGSMLMNLGSLVTITACAPPNLTVLLFDNGVYEVTGSQPTAAAGTARADGTAVDFAAIARACGFRRVWTFDDAAAWREKVADCISGPGPAFVHLLIQPIVDPALLISPGRSPERAEEFRHALTGAESRNK